MKISRAHVFAALLVTGAAVALASFFWANGPDSRAAQPVQQASAEKPVPTLNCAFYDFTRASIVVGFDFAAMIAGREPQHFEQRAQALRDGTQSVFDAGQRPVWPFAHDDDGHPTITSPDGATRIVLYGLKLDQGGAFFIEAGLRSNVFRNLNGQCQQANFGGRPDTMSTERSTVIQ